MDPNDYDYTTYIRATPDTVWAAFTEPGLTERFWGVTHTAEWAAGGSMTWHVAGVTIADPEQRVLVAEAPSRLSFTWHTITPEFGAAVGGAPEATAAMAAEPRSTVIVEIEPFGGHGPTSADDPDTVLVTRVTVTQTGFEPGSTIREGVEGGWPIVLSSLKSLLETGSPLAFP